MKAKVSESGALSWRFTRPVIVPPFFVGKGTASRKRDAIVSGTSDEESDEEMTEALMSVFDIQLRSNFFESGAWQLEIKAIELVAFTSQYLEIQLTLSYPDYITLSLVEPDTLNIRVMTPELFIDEKTFTRMEENYEF